jgi:hypothetical protein
MYGANGGSGANPSAHLMFEVASNAGPVLFTGLHLDGGWDGTTMAAGEWDHLIELRGASNVTIESNLLENPYGDCVFLGGAYLPPSQGVVIRNNTCRNPWRCTVGIVSANGALVVGNTLDKPNGGPRPADPTGANANTDVWYQFNIDFEPDPYPDVTPAESDWNVELAFNEISAHIPPSRYPWDLGIAVVFSHKSTGFPPDGLV